LAQKLLKLRLTSQWQWRVRGISDHSLLFCIDWA